MVLHGCHKGLVADFKIIKQNTSTHVTHVTILTMTIEIICAVYKVTKNFKNSQLKFLIHVVKLISARELVYKLNPLF